MLDTIKIGIPLTEKQHSRVIAVAFESDREQWVLYFPKTPELRFRKVTGLAEAHQNSFHREIRWDVTYDYRPSTYKADGSWLDGTCLIVELSLPKLRYGHNVHLLYDFTEELKKLKQLLEKRFNLQGKGRLLDVMQWQVWRADVCYAWRMPDQQIAQLVLDSLKHLHYPRKKPTIYPTAIVFAGSTYTVKFYLKLPEFKAHDLKALIKGGASYEWINSIEEKATGVLRYEATLRRKYLSRQNIKTVADLTRPLIKVELDQHLVSNGEDPDMVVSAIMANNWEVSECLDESDFLEQMWDGRRLTMPEGGVTYRGGMFNTEEKYEHQSGGLIVRRRDNPTEILQYFLDKFIGEHGMQKADEIEVKLMEVYKPVKAARLLSFWLYIQRFGTERAKEMFGHNSYYVAKRDLKKAGISLIEATDTAVTLRPDFMRTFKLQIPSEHVTNKHDDYPDHDNILNFVPRPTSG